MIKKDNFQVLLESLGFKKTDDVYTKKFNELETELKVDFKNQKLIYPEDDGFVVNERQTCNFKQAENFVVFECVHRLLSQGYKPNHIELEPKWQVGHGASGGRADILIKDNDNKALLIIECKTAGSEFSKAWNTTQVKPTQLFSYVQQIRTTQFIVLYASDFVDDKVKADYYLISVKDNEILLNNNPNLKSYKAASTVEEIYSVWSDTYKKEYATQGLFENSEAYHIGKDKYSLEDLKTVTSKDIQGKYHEFATIMRQHNVSGRENAFDKLVNLFLCKVVDETNNADELKFYWKGIAFDDPFSLQDRLNHLYKVGMKKFLGEDITYIENKQIDDAFSVFKDKPNMTKEIIEGFFKELKFFTNNDFAFIDVHNEELFYQNFEVLLKIVKMLQDIRLTGGEDNQFLGDMFEGFLDQGIKQSEGQFFTPMPIVKFIVNSLPLEKILQEDEPKAIDYACGAGHFLNEVANNFPKDKHKNIVGIEKEYRLSKVAKVSAFMYAQDDINIIYADALSSKAKVKKEDFSLLVANPPYSVKGFLETLNEDERKEYELISTLEEKSFSANNAIECFFVEKTKQLLKGGGVAGLILPSSILSKGNGNNIYVKTREILLKYFDIMAIAEFGNGTFGKTGTNTVTLFLQKRSSNPDMAKHLQNMCDVWFSGDFSINELFKDKDLLQEYCKHIEVECELYKTLLKNEYDEELFKVEMFSEYIKEFAKSTETKNRKKQRQYKVKTSEEKEQIEKQKLIEYVRAIEKDKLYYFCVAYINKKETLLIKAPSDGAKNKKFLGYAWSGRKGDEGIKYITSQNTTTKTDDEEGLLENILNLNNIQTPLYNPKDFDDTTKINTLIKQNFLGETVEIPEELSEYVIKARVVEMLDFSQKEFSKGFNMTPKKKLTINTKWQVVKLFEYVDINKKSINPLKTPQKKYNYVDIDSVEKISGKISFSNQILGKDAPSRARRIAFVENILISTVRPNLKGFSFLEKEQENTIYSTGFAILESKDKEKLLPKLIYYYFMYSDFLMLQIESVMGKASYPSINKNDIENFKIPLPPKPIQEKIIKECQKVDNKVEKAKVQIEKAKQKIEESFNTLHQKASNSFKLSDSDSFDVSIGKRVLQKEVSQDKTLTPIYSANVFEVFGYIDKDILKDFSKPSVIWGIDGDWMVNHISANRSFYPTDHCGVLRVKNSELNSRYVAFVLDKEGKEKRFSRTLRASIDRIKTITIKAPSKQEQDNFALETEKLERTINKANEIIQKAPKAKEEILKGYLE